MKRIASPFVTIVLIAIVLLSAASALAATNTVPATRLTDRSGIVSVADLNPGACASIAVTTILYCPNGGGPCSGTDASELIIGSTASDDIQGGKGNDCILGGGGDDTFRGEQGTDVCIGGLGTDAFHPSCETRTQ